MIRWYCNMNDNNPFLVMEIPCEQAVASVIHWMSRAGVSILRTFDLRTAHIPYSECPCPHHCTEQCDCQLIILLAYAGDGAPVSLVAHGYEGKTWFSLVDSPQQPADSDLFALIQQVLTSPPSHGFDASLLSNAVR